MATLLKLKPRIHDPRGGRLLQDVVLRAVLSRKDAGRAANRRAPPVKVCPSNVQIERALQSAAASAVGPTLPACAVHKVVSYLRYLGRVGRTAAMAVFDPGCVRTTKTHCNHARTIVTRSLQRREPQFMARSAVVAGLERDLWDVGRASLTPP